LYVFCFYVFDSPQYIYSSCLQGTSFYARTPIIMIEPSNISKSWAGIALLLLELPCRGPPGEDIVELTKVRPPSSGTSDQILKRPTKHRVIHKNAVFPPRLAVIDCTTLQSLKEPSCPLFTLIDTLTRYGAIKLIIQLTYGSSQSPNFAFCLVSQAS
jgi:hypothetical protein